MNRPSYVYICTGDFDDSIGLILAYFDNAEAASDFVKDQSTGVFKNLQIRQQIVYSNVEQFHTY